MGKANKNNKVEITSINELLIILVSIDKAVWKVLDNIKKNQWQRDDSRLLLLLDFHENNFVTMYQLSLIARGFNLTNSKTWWKNEFTYLSEKIEVLSDINNFSLNMLSKTWTNIREYYVFKTFTSFESSVRNIVRVIGNVKYRGKILNGTEEFHKIRQGFFIEHLHLDNISIESLKLLQELRNLFHNSGFYFKKEDTILLYKRRTYEFKNGKPIFILTLQLLEELTIDLIGLIEKTLNHPTIKSISKIEDTASQIQW